MSNGYKIAGWITFSIGFLLGLVYALPESPDIFMFGTGGVLCVVGIIFLQIKPARDVRRPSRDDGSPDSQEQSGDPTAPHFVFDADTSMQHLVWFVEQIKPELSNQELQQQIEKIQLYQIAPMVKYRHQLQDDLGMESFAHAYSFFASGERYLNRAWSAVVDGYRDEAFNCLTTAREAFASCREALKVS